jgi:hypothetical protein
MIEHGQTGKTQYELHVESEWRHIGLYGLCFLVFLIALAFMFVMAALSWLEAQWSMILATAFVFGSPVALYFYLRRRLSSRVIVTLSADTVEVERGGKRRIIHKDSIKNYEAHFHEWETYDTERVIIQPIDGPKITLWTTSTSGKLKLMTAFRLDFERWAEANQLKRFEPWYRRWFQ